MPTINYPGTGNNPYNVKVKPTPADPKYGIQFGSPGSEYEFNQENLLGRYKDITDFNSPFYAQFRKYLSSAIPQVGTNALLAPLMAGNVDYGTAQKLGSQRASEMNVQRNEAINKGVQSFSLEAQSQANPLLGQMGNNYFNMMNYWENQRQFDEMMKREDENTKKSFWENIVKGGIGIGSMFIPGMQGVGAASFASMAMPKSPYGG